MSEDEWRAFLISPVRPGILSTTRLDGTPHAAPIWFDLDDNSDIYFNTGRETIKGRNLRRTGWASLCVQDDQVPYSFVTLNGPVSLSEDLDQVRQWATRIGGRYMGSDRAEEMGARNGVPGELIVRLTPEQVVAYRDVAD